MILPFTHTIVRFFGVVIFAGVCVAATGDWLGVAEGVAVDVADGDVVGLAVGVEVGFGATANGPK